MRCPFLREAQVKYCRASAYRKMIVRVPGQPEADLCTSSAYASCPAFTLQHGEPQGGSHCPFLQEALVQYCGAASVTKYIPYSEALLSQCGTESHKYCQLFLTMAHPERARLHAHGESDPAAGECSLEEYLVDGIPVPGWLHYSNNHLWADWGSEGTVHIGIDAFLAGMLGSVDRIVFVTTQGIHRPAVALTVNGTDLHLLFPLELQITNVNSYLRSHPDVLLADPYARGWLFEGTFVDPAQPSRQITSPSGLLTGASAVAWMREEVRRVTTLAHECSHVRDEEGSIVMADGGTVQPGLLSMLSREQVLQVFNEFFSPFADRRSGL